MKKYRRLQNLLFYFVFSVYVVIVLQIILFKSVPVWQIFSENRRMLRGLNIVPFYYFITDDMIARTFAFSNIFGNIILFIPLGVYLPVLRRSQKVFGNILLIFFMSLSVEILQYLFAIGITDIDDVFLNCAGGFVGLVLYKALLLMTKSAEKARFVITIIAPLAGALCVFLIAVFG